MFVNGKCFLSVCGLRLLCAGRWEFQISLQGKPGRPINAFKSKLHLCPKLFTTTNKRSLLQLPIRTIISKSYIAQVVLTFLCAGAKEGNGQSWIKHWGCGFQRKLTSYLHWKILGLCGFLLCPVVSVLWFLGLLAQSCKRISHCFTSFCFSQQNKNPKISNCQQILPGMLSKPWLLSVSGSESI